MSLFKNDKYNFEHVTRTVFAGGHTVDQKLCKTCVYSWKTFMENTRKRRLEAFSRNTFMLIFQTNVFSETPRYATMMDAHQI
jgi:hypothetical protein